MSFDARNDPFTQCLLRFRFPRVITPFLRIFGFLWVLNVDETVAETVESPFAGPHHMNSVDTKWRPVD